METYVERKTREKTERLQNRQLKAFSRLVKDKNIIRKEKRGDEYVFTYKDGAVFTCRGFLPDNTLFAYAEIK